MISPRLLQQLLESLPDGLSVIDLDQRLIIVNEALCTLTGFSREELIGLRPPFPYWASTTIFEIQAGIQRGLSGDLRDLETIFMKKDGTLFHVLVHPSRIVDNSGKTRFLLATVKDMSERRQMEEALRHKHRIETLGTLAAGIAHDFNNLLVPILTNTELLLRQAPALSETYAELTEILQAAHRARDLVSRILVFGRGAEERYEPVVVSHVVREALQFLAHAIPANITLLLNTEDETLTVQGDHSQLSQVVINLVTNAYQAMGVKAGKIQVAVEKRKVTGMHQASFEGLAACISVRDSGPGIPPEVVARIFDPFFTTKPIGEGSGLGLSTVEAITVKHGGFLKVESEIGHGTLFEVFFPAIPTPSFAAPLAPPDRAQTRALHALLVDDEPLVRSVLERLLSTNGLTVTSAQSAEDALTLAQSHQFDVLVTDYSMPKMTGLELAVELSKRVPALPVIMITGLENTALIPQAPPNVRAVLRKPTITQELLQAISDATARTGI